MSKTVDYYTHWVLTKRFTQLQWSDVIMTYTVHYIRSVVMGRNSNCTIRSCSTSTYIGTTLISY